jgi:hypothetical protein
MKSYSNSVLTFFVKLILAACLLAPAGCAQSNHAVKSSSLTENSAVLQKLTVTGEGDDSKIVISANQPMTYTNYTIADPPQVVVDLSLTDPGSLKSPIYVKSSVIKSIEILKNESSGRPLTRVIIKLVKPTDFNIAADPASQNKLILSLVKQSQSQKISTENNLNTNSVVTSNNLSPLQKLHNSNL